METALVKVCSGLIGMMDSGEHALLALLDPSSAFDTVDHDSSVSIVWGAWRRPELDAQLFVGPHPYHEIRRH